jgi:glucosyl-dolichyl phosphate glucuronosyltransferase
MREAVSMRISVIICAYTLERWRELSEAITSVHLQTRRADEIVLVIDHETTLLKKCENEFLDIKIINNIECKGLAGARNSGIAASTGDLIAFLDDDAIADPQWLKLLEKEFDVKTTVGVGSAVTPLWGGKKPRWFPDEFLWVVGCSYVGLKAGRVRNVIGAGMCVKKAAFDWVGGYDSRLGRMGSNLPISCEETEFCIRVTNFAQGCQFVYQPSSKVLHRVSKGRGTIKYFLLRCFAEGVSKGRLVNITESRAPFNPERRYIIVVLSTGFLRGFGELIWSLDVWGPIRSLAICVGLSSAVVGFLFERFNFHRTTAYAGNTAR